MPSTWFIPATAVLPSSRIDATLGMRTALRISHDRVVPGLASLGFARQAAWACGAISLVQNAKQVNLSHTRVANAIEALACKHVFQTGGAHAWENVRGVTRLSLSYQDPAQWSYTHLSQPKNYVTQPYRQSTTEALTAEGGLGFVKAGATRFNAMELSERGVELAKAFLSQKVSRNNLGTVLQNWLSAVSAKASGGVILDMEGAMLNALRPGQPSDDERIILAKTLSQTLTPGQTKSHGGDDQRRARLYRWLEGMDSGAIDGISMQNLENLLQRDDTSHATFHWHAVQENFYLERFLNSARGILGAIIQLHYDGRTSSVLDQLVRQTEVAAACAQYHVAGREYQQFMTAHPHLESAPLSLDPQEKSDSAIIEGIAQQVPLLMRIERNKLVSGTLMRTPPNLQLDRDLVAMRDIHSGNWLPRRVHQLRRLVKECSHG